MSEPTVPTIRAVFISEQQLRFEETTLPAPQGAQVLVQVLRSIISAGTELANYTGLDPDTRIPGRWCAYPWNPGYGGIGKVLAAGPAVRGIAPGDLVYAQLHHGTHDLIDTAGGFCVKVPAGMDPTIAAFVRMGNVAISAYQRSQVALGDRVAVIGLGLVGNLAGQFYSAAGQTVVGLDLAAHRRKLAEEIGFHATVDPSQYATPEALAARLAEVLGGPPRVVVDAVGDSRLVELGVTLAASNGQVIILGTPRAPYETDCTGFLKLAHVRGISIVGALEWTIPLLKWQTPGHSTESNAELIFGLMARGELQVAPLLSHVIAPDQLDEAYQGLLHRKDDYLGVVVDWEHHPAPAVTWRRDG